MSNRNKLNKILSGKSTWEEEAKWRKENEEWLSQSFEIAMRVLDTLRAKSMTQKELAEKLNVSPQFINKVVKGQENLSLDTINKLSRALGIKLIEVVEVNTSSEVTYDYEQAYELSQQYRKEVFTQASALGYVGLESMQLYVKEQLLEYKIPA
ncbi:MAG: transcriptional regulator [Flammeovirgaceae bacterium]